MKFHLLVAASALVVGLGANGAFAGNDGHDNHGNNGHDPQTTAVGVAVALNSQEGASVFNFAKGTDGANTIGTVSCFPSPASAVTRRTLARFTS